MNGTSWSEIIDEASRWTVGGGIITLVLFPLALPFIVLAAVAALPLLLIGLAGALVVAVVALPVLLVRGLVRRAIGRARDADRTPSEHRPADGSPAMAGWS